MTEPRSSAASTQAEVERPVVLVTGCDGLIGQRVLKAIRNDYRVVGLDRPPLEKPMDGVDFVQCDLTKDESVADAMRQVRELAGQQVASVIHLAAYYDFSGEPSPLYDKLTVEGTRRLLKQLQNFDVEQFVFSSSLLVMKPSEEGELISETSETEGAWDYPASKLKAEAAIREERGGIPTVVLRIAGVYDEDCRSLPIAQQISRIYERTIESYFFPGEAEHGQAFVHLDDLVDCFVKVIEHRKDLPREEMLLVAEPDVMSYEELQDRIGEALHGKEWPTIRIPKLVAKAGAWVKDKMATEEHPAFIKPWMIDLADTHYPVDIQRAERQLNWTPKHRLRETLPTMIEHLKQDPALWHKENGLPLPPV